jgi:outer membrane immunogenic protein
MRKLFVSIAILFVSTLLAVAQGPISKGQKQINAGLGFDDWGIPLYIGLDYGVHPDITVGGEFAFASEHGVSIIGLKGNGNYHFNKLFEINRSWDVYAGLNIGLYFWSWSDYGPGQKHSNSDFDLGLQFGGRYYFNTNWGINLELAINTFPEGKIGVSYRF